MVELIRCADGLEVLSDWFFVDTLHIFRTVSGDLTGGCVKLQDPIFRMLGSP